MTTHVSPPWICCTCTDLAERQAEQIPHPPTVLVVCHHIALNRAVVGIATARAGRIEAWDLHGPMTRSEAAALERSTRSAKVQQ